MKRKVTALLLAMAFVLATVAPTLAAGNEKAAANKTATVSVEKSKRKRKPKAAAVRSRAAKEEEKKAEETLKEPGSETKPEEKEDKPSTEPKKEDTPNKKDKATEVEHEFTFSLRNKSDQLLTGAEFILTMDEAEKDQDDNEGKSEDPIAINVNPKELKLKQGKYTLKKIKAPEGYDLPSEIKFEVKEKGEVTIADDEKALTFDQKEKLLIVKAEKQGIKTLFSLQDIFENELSGATLEIRKDNKPVKEWVSGETPASIVLTEGKYQLIQTTIPEKQEDAPDGYIKADAIDFEITKEGKIKSDNKVQQTANGDNVLIMVNDYKEGHIFYSVQDIDGNELAGSHLRIVKRDGDSVAFWIADKTPKSIKLDPGSYRLELVQGPQGNEVAEAVDFTISGDGKIEAETEGHLEKFKNHKMLFLTAKHEEINFYFGLRDILDRELAGGQLQIRDQVTGKVVKEWTSGSAPKGFRLEAGKYTLVQVTAPKGYTVARSVDFEISKEGKIIADGAHLKLFGDRKILTLVNACKNNMVEFSKVTPEGKALSGASLEIYKDTTKLASWKSDAGLYRMEFEPGTYRFHEVAAPQGYKPVSDFEFEVKADGTITLGTIQNGESVALKNGRIIVTDQVDKPAPTENKKPESNTNKDKSYWVEFDVAKKDGTLLDGAVVEIYQNGKLLESWTSSATGYKTKLQPGSYRFHTKTAPKGYQLARDFNFAVNRDGSITLGKLQSGDTVTARNGKITVYGDPVSASGVRTAGTAQGGNGKLPKTGDGISPVVYAVGLVAVGAVILGIGIKKRRESVDEVK